MNKKHIEFSQPREGNYEERSQVMNAEQREAVMGELRDKFAELQRLAATDKFTSLRGVNVAREIGAQIELFTGHEKLLPAEFEPLSVALKDAPLEFAKKCLALHQKFPQEVDNHAIARAEWEQLMVQLELLPKPARESGDGGQPDEPIKDCLSTVIKMNQELVKLSKENDISKWPPFLRQTFLKQGKPYFEIYQQAIELEGGSAVPTSNPKP